MTFNYSICHPNKRAIEYRNDAISGEDVLKIAQNYPWLEILASMEKIHPDSIYYSPSLDFTCIDNEKSFCLTANYNETNNLEFSLWYNRPKTVNILFGLLGKKEKMVVDDIWSIDFEKALHYLEHFVNGNYDVIEALYEK
jgi:DNA polymerase III epsilon subunit-like protein